MYIVGCKSVEQVLMWKTELNEFFWHSMLFSIMKWKNVGCTCVCVPILIFEASGQFLSKLVWKVYIASQLSTSFHIFL